jgi:glycosyltransferase involved in cell wall biosynthesis
MMKPEVSVVMSVYNGERDLAASIDSILRQEGLDFEFVIVDDGSSDGSADLLDFYARRDSRIRVIRQENQGLTRALIRGCTEARGEFVARQDVGDISLSGRLAKQLAMIKSDPAAVLVSCGTRFVGPRGEHLFDVLQTDREAKEGLTTRELKSLRGPSCHPCTLFRRSAYVRVGGYRHQFRMAQDIDLWVRLVEVGTHRVVPEVLFQAEFALSGISAGRHRHQLWFDEQILKCAAARRQGASEEEILREVEEYSNRSRRSKRGKGEAAYFIGSLLQKKDPERAKEYLILALKENSLHVKAYLRLVGALLRSRF